MSDVVTFPVAASEELVADCGGLEEFCRRMVGQVCRFPPRRFDGRADPVFVTGWVVGPGYAVVTSCQPIPGGGDMARATVGVCVTIRQLGDAEMAQGCRPQEATPGATGTP